MAIPPFQPVPERYDPKREREFQRVLERTLDRLDYDLERVKNTGGGGGGGTVSRGIGATLKTENSNVLLVGTEVTIILPFDLTLSTSDSWVIASNTVCSVVVDVRRATVANPNTFVSIAASAKPTLTADDYASGAMTGWATSLLAGERIRFVVQSASGTTGVQVMIPAEDA
jgi:hypothetical protein